MSISSRSSKSVEAIARDLVKIPSFVRDGTNERAVADYLVEFLNRHTSMRVETQVLTDGRCNVVAQSDDGEPHLLLAGHMDTVEPKAGWQRDQYGQSEDHGRLYGLGSYDMKSGIAAILHAVAEFQPAPPGLQLLFYCDEEYDFQGMRAFLDAVDNGERNRPRRCVITEPTDLKPQRAHRGLVELNIVVRGRTGHAGDPSKGTNAIDGLTEVLKRLRRKLRQFRSDALGIPTVNLAYLHGGLATSDDVRQERPSREGNNIADWAEAVIDIRTTVIECNAAWIEDYIRAQALDLNLGVLAIEMRHDLGALDVPERDLDFLEQALKEQNLPVAYRDARTLGYGDGQMIWQRWSIPVAYLGPTGDGMHAVDEYVELESLLPLARTLTSLIRICCSGERPVHPLTA